MMRRYRHRCRWPRVHRSGQGIIEYLLVVGAVLLGIFAIAGVVSNKVGDIAREGDKAMEGAADLLASAPELPSWFEESAQEDPELAEEDEEDDEITIAAGPGFGPPVSGGSGGGGGGGSGGGGGGGSGSGGDGGGSGSGGDGGGSGDGDGGSGGGGGGSSGNFGPPNEIEQALIDAALSLLLNSPVTFQLFDFAQGALAIFNTAQVVQSMLDASVPIRMGDLVGSLAEVHFSVDENGNVVLPPIGELFMAFDRTWMQGKTVEQVASVLAHEAWHVFQVLSGRMNDYANYPRTVDIEYESFVAGSAAWDLYGSGQSEPTLDAGSACVAQGEARCKEILATDFNYGSGLRLGSI